MSDVDKHEQKPLELLRRWFPTILALAAAFYSLGTTYLRGDFMTISSAEKLMSAMESAAKSREEAAHGLIQARILANESLAAVKDTSYSNRLDELAQATKANNDKLDKIIQMLLQRGR